MLCFIFVGITLLFQNVHVANAEEVVECGTILGAPQPLALGWSNPTRGAVPWHVVIYQKTTQPYRAICAGSLITKDKLISVAHCFWSPEQRLLPASDYAAAAGKLFRPWADPNDSIAQKSDIKEIHVPERFVGLAANLQDDISLLVLSQPFTINNLVRPVCLNFDRALEKRLLQPGKEGTAAGWNAAPGKLDFSLKITKMAYVDLAECILSSPEIREFISSDKFCAGSIRSNSSLCRGDSGAGLAFPFLDMGRNRFYIQGVASSKPSANPENCEGGYSVFTHISQHKDFINNLLLV